MNFLSYIEFYYLPLLAAIILSATLSLFGIHLAARQKPVETLCVGQGAAIGVMLGVILSIPHNFSFMFPLTGALLVSLMLTVVTRKRVSKNSAFIAVYATLWAAGQILLAKFPNLESHLIQAYFGDIATISNNHSIIAIIVAAIALCYILYRWRETINESFEVAILKKSPHSSFSIVSIILVVFSVQYVGLLFTLGCLFLPTVIFASKRIKKVRTHSLYCVACSTVGTLLGFVYSLYDTQLPSTPSVIIFILMSASILTLFSTIHFNRQERIL